MSVLFSCEITATFYAAKIHSMHAWLQTKRFGRSKVDTYQWTYDLKTKIKNHNNLQLSQLWLNIKTLTQQAKKLLLLRSTISTIKHKNKCCALGSEPTAYFLSLCISETGASLPCATIIPHFRQPLHKNCKHSPTSCLRPWSLTSVSYGRWSPTDVSVPQSPPLPLSGWVEAFSEDFLGWASLTRPGSLAQGRGAKTLCWENPSNRWSFIQHSCQLFACQPGGVKAKWECRSRKKWQRSRL